VCVATKCTPIDASSADRASLILPGLDASRRDGGLCSGTAYRAEIAPVDASLLDAYLMVDQSSSMNDPVASGGSTWWAALETGLSNFVNSPSAAGMAMGIQYFPLGGMEPTSCSADYATPEIEIAALPGNAGALISSIQSHAPTGFTPTGPALTGAISHMKVWAGGHPGRVPVVVLVTDGFPTECSPTQITDIAAIARNGATTEPRVRTFVVGLNLGKTNPNLDAIAEAGGTHAAFLISDAALETELGRAMLSISVTPLSCIFQLPEVPDGGVFEPSLVTLRYTPKSQTTPMDVPRVSSAADCPQTGLSFYFDPPGNPTRAVACPATCASTDDGTLEFRAACATKPPPPNR
jgi:hypothetical protein